METQILDLNFQRIASNIDTFSRYFDNKPNNNLLALSIAWTLDTLPSYFSPLRPHSETLNIIGSSTFIVVELLKKLHKKVKDLDPLPSLDAWRALITHAAKSEQLVTHIGENHEFALGAIALLYHSYNLKRLKKLYEPERDFFKYMEKYTSSLIALVSINMLSAYPGHIPKHVKDTLMFHHSALRIIYSTSPSLKNVVSPDGVGVRLFLSKEVESHLSSPDPNVVNILSTYTSSLINEVSSLEKMLMHLGSYMYSPMIFGAGLEA